MRIQQILVAPKHDNNHDIQDGKEESDSVTNQRAFLKKYISGHEDFVGASVKEFLDDGYTGRNLDRPGFQEMIMQCRAGKVGCIVVKDLSRLGRNYVEVGNLLEQVFPFLGIRVVSVNDGYDSASLNGQTGGIDVAFKNLVYSLYSRDLSHKVKSAVETRMKRGEYIGPFAFFGYQKDPEDIHKLVIDGEAAAIVRRIFRMVGGGMRRNEVVKILNEEGVPTPAVYKQKKGCTRDWFPEGKKGGWNTSMVAKIIRDERYAGHMVSGKKVYEHFDSKKQVGVDKSDWIVVRDTHEGIVTQEEFDRANANMRSVVQGKKKEPANKGNYSVIICPHCGLTLRPGTQKESILYCPTGRMHRDSPCSRGEDEEDACGGNAGTVCEEAGGVFLEAEKMLKGRKAGKNPGADAEGMREEIRKLDEAKISVYEDYKAGKVTREMFLERKKMLDVKRQELSAAVSELEAREVVEEAGKREYREAFRIQEYLHLETYDKQVMASLIASAKVMGEGRMEVAWKYGDVYKKILGEMQ
ncbi:MAG: recombinase family protein [Lachnospiraceae bacterium]|nr:recombinase family protein [Lachnospiraceae bacterium]